MLLCFAFAWPTGIFSGYYFFSLFPFGNITTTLRYWMVGKNTNDMLFPLKRLFSSCSFFSTGHLIHPSAFLESDLNFSFSLFVCICIFCRSVFTRQQQQQQKPFQRLGVDGAIYFYFFSPLFNITILPHWQALICKLKREKLRSCRSLQRRQKKYK